MKRLKITDKNKKILKIAFNILAIFCIAVFCFALTPKEFQPFYKTFNKNFCFVGTTIKERLQKQNKNYKRYKNERCNNARRIKKIFFGY